MDKVARLPAADRAALFNQTGAARGVANAIIEKDFWVCWTLKRIFGLQGDDNPGLVFKGGTSLSKAYGAIRRFSEDIDLSFDRKDLGYGGERDPETVAAASKKKAPSPEAADRAAREDAEIERALNVMEKVWRRLVEMMMNIQRDMQKKG